MAQPVEPHSVRLVGPKPTARLLQLIARRSHLRGDCEAEKATASVAWISMTRSVGSIRCFATAAAFSGLLTNPGGDTETAR